MKQRLNELVDADPSKVIGRLVGIGGAIVAYLATLTPLLEGVKGWGDAFFVILVASSSRFATLLTALKAYKPSTVKTVAENAFLEGFDAAQTEAREARLIAAQKGIATKKAKKLIESQPIDSAVNPKPKVQKRQKSKKRDVVNPKARQTKKVS